MGYESYNLVLLGLDDIDLFQVKTSLIEMGYVTCGNNSFEKILQCGIIEILFDKKTISIRTAKANDVDIIDKIIEDICLLKDVISFDVFDCQQGSEISQKCFDKIKKCFNVAHSDFKELFPAVGPPIRCCDVFKVSTLRQRRK